MVSADELPESKLIAESRGTSTKRLKRALDGDLDNIVLMAMRKEPERRYGSAEQMASDIQRSLEGKPVIARRDTVSYRTSKFVKRHWLPLSAAAAATFMIIAFSVTTFEQSVRIAAERDRAAQQRERAERERERAEEVSGFLVNLFKLSDPEENRGNQVTARELLDSGSKRLEAGLQNQPETKAALLSTVGAVYDSLGQFKDALPILDEALHLQGPSHDASHIGTLLEVANARIGTGNLPGAEPPLQDALHISQSEFGAKSIESGRTLWALGRLRFQQGRFGEAKDLFAQSLAILRSDNAPQTDISSLLDDLAKVYTRGQQWLLAKQTYEQALDIDRRVLGDDHPRISQYLDNLAFVAQNMGDLKQAEILYRDALNRKKATYGERHPETAMTKGNYGLLLQREGRLTEAEPLLRDAVAIRLSLFGLDNYNVGYGRVSLAMLLHDKGDLAASENEFRQALAIYDKSLPANHQYRAALLMHFARLLVDRNKSAEALSKSEESIKIWTATSPATNPQTALAHAIHAYALEHLDKLPLAAEELDAAVPVLTKARGPDDAAVRRALIWQKIADPDAVQTASTGVTVHRP
jgi:tetratricopeptide (TPR) repeat protein